MGDEGNILVIKINVNYSGVKRRREKEMWTENRLMNLLCERKKEKVSERTITKDRKTEGMKKKKIAEFWHLEERRENKRLVEEKPT